MSYRQTKEILHNQLLEVNQMQEYLQECKIYVELNEKSYFVNPSTNTLVDVKDERFDFGENMYLQKRNKKWRLK